MDLKVNTKYTHIFFDLDNTLWDFEKNSYLALKRIFSQYFPETTIAYDDFFEVYSKHNKQLWENYKNRQISKDNLVHSRFQRTFDELGLLDTDPLEMNSSYLSEMAKQKKLVDGAYEILDYLWLKKYQLFIITNGFEEVQIKKLKNTGIIGFFTKIFISEKVKVPKPGREIFEYAIKSANARKRKSLMIGDDFNSDIIGAVEFGMDAVYFANNGFSQQQREIIKNYGHGKKICTIEHLSSLKNIL
ncbi:MAG: noncanonical pyrimidine nucleotidase, YjjG family [Draconibacterium sp.]|nr:MAG: noncanonical pyrimidine nucleotidase, YjjG family [Draconibacterium sp.]